MERIIARYPLDLYIKLCHNFITNTSGERTCCQYKYNNFWTINHWEMDLVLASQIMECLGYSKGGYKLVTLRNHYLDEEVFKSFVREFESTKKSRYTLGMNFTMGVKRKGGCLSSMFLVGKGKGDPDVYINFKTCEIPKKFFADLVFIDTLIRDLGLINCKVYISSACRFYWLLPSQALIPLFGRKRITNPIILNSGFYRGRYEYRGVASLRENNQMLAKKYGKEILCDGILDGLVAGSIMKNSVKL